MSFDCSLSAQSKPAGAFITVDRQTGYLLQLSLEDWLPEDHLARFIVEVIDRLELTELTRTYGGRGSAPFLSEMLQQ